VRRVISRRTAAIVLAVGAAAVLVAVLALQALPQAGPGSTASNLLPYDGPRSIDFDAGWKFALVNPNDISDPSGVYGNASAPRAQAVDFDDSAWRSVTLPHDWSIELLPQATGVSNASGYFQGGLGWYRKTFTLPPSMAGRSISLEFDGVYMDSYEYLNGKPIGSHAYGYTGFSLDVTKAVRADGVTPNVLAVVVQNELPSSRWYSGSGITRNVRLTVTDPVHIIRNGVFVTTPTVESDYASGFASVHAAIDAVDASGAGATVEIAAKVVDASGSVVAQSSSGSVQLGKDARHTALELKVDHPHLWSTSDPYLYSLEADVVRNGVAVDTYRTAFGIRWLRFDPESGFYLNGLPMKLHGVNLHNDQGALGSVDSSDALVRQMSILKKMGVNAVRTSHNPPSPEWLAVCDRLGILEMVEAFDSWSQGKSTYDYSRFFNERSDSDIQEMVYEARNSPSVIMWSIGNEIRDPASPSLVKTAQRLIDDIRALDPTRPIVSGADQYRVVPAEGTIQDQILKKLDGLGVNYETAQALDRLHASYPTKFFFESETASAESSRGVYQDPQDANTGENYTPGRRGTSSYDNNLAPWTMSAQYALKSERDRPFDLGQFIWSGFDYIGEPTPYDVFPVKASFFGALDTAGLPKDSYYLFQSQWTDAPMVHLAPMNWTDHKVGDEVQVWVYSNVESVELTLNGRSLGTKTFDRKTTLDGRTYLETTEPSLDDKTFPSGSYTSPNGSTGKLHLTWEVPFEPGRLVAVASRAGEVVARDEIATAGAPAGFLLTPDRVVLPNDGKSLSYVEVDVVDSHGVVVPSAGDLVEMTVTGGTLAGMDNGRQESAEGYKGASHTAYNGKLVAIVGSTAATGPITLAARSDDLSPATVTIYSSAITGTGLVALAPAYLRRELGAPILLPGTVQAIHANGTQETVAVRWSDLPAESTTVPGVYEVAGSVSGVSVQAKAVVTVYSVASLETYSTAVVKGAEPRLPPTIRLIYTDGVDARVPVKWDAVAPARYAETGLVTVNGTVVGTSIKAIARVRVADPSGPRQNLALASGPLHPVADASFSGTPQTVPAGMLDGVTTPESWGWSNYYVKDATALLPAFSRAHASEWVSVSWPNAQTFDTVLAYFVTDESRVLPSRIDVSCWDGAAWVPARHVKVVPGSPGNPTTISFDRETASAVRLDLTSPAPGTEAGFLEITELQVMGSPVSDGGTALSTLAGWGRSGHPGRCPDGRAHDRRHTPSNLSKRTIEDPS
jgi:beta-galactosidase